VPISSELLRKVLAPLLGAAIGVIVALLLELAGHPSWSILLLLISAVVPGALSLLSEPVSQLLRPLRSFGGRRPGWQKLGATLLMVAATVGGCLVFDYNPRVAYYLPLLPAVLVSAALFGFGPGLFAVVLGTVAADYFFAPPVFDFGITEWRDVLGLAVLGIVGAFLALLIAEFLSFPE
jgi:Domain of unknown function (DUF4118)